MNLPACYQSLRRQWFWKARGLVLAMFLLGALLGLRPVGPLDRLAFDLTSVLGGPAPPASVVLVELNSQTKTNLHQPANGPMDRRLYAQAVRRLQREGARVVMVDLLFEAPSGDPQADEDFGIALREHGAAVLAVRLFEQQEDSHHTLAPIPPIPALATNAAAWGSSAVAMDPDEAVRRHMTNLPAAPGLGWQAAWLLGKTPPPDYESDGVAPPTRFMRWPVPHEFSRVDFTALLETNSVLRMRDAVVILGTKPGPGFPGGQKDVFRSPWTRFGGGFVSGPTVHAASFSNWSSGDWIREMSALERLAMGGGWAALMTLQVWWMNARRSGRVWLVWLALFVSLLFGGVAAGVLFHTGHVWWPWLLPVSVPPLVAVAWVRRQPAPLPIDVFISYRRHQADGETARLLFNELNARGLVVFYAPANMPPGPFPAHLTRSIHRARCVVPILSPGTFSSRAVPEDGGTDWVRVEIETARRAGKPILPVFKQGFTLGSEGWPPEVGTAKEWEDYTRLDYSAADGEVGELAEKIVRSVRALAHER